MSAPHSPEAERALLGCLLGSPAAQAQAGDVREDDFYLSFHRAVFLAIRAVADRDEAVDLVTVGRELGEAGAVGLLELADAAPYWHNVGHYAAIVMRDGTRRRGMDALIRAHAALATGEPDEVFADVRMSVADLEARGKGGWERIGSHLSGVLEEIGGQGGQEKAPAVASGIALYDQKAGPFRAEQLVVVAARPGIGKTAFAGGCALRAALRGTPILIFSLEMSRTEMIKRFIGAHTGTSVEALSQGMGGEEFRRVYSESRALYDIPLALDTRMLTVGQLAASARTWRARHPGPKAMIWVDYLGLIKPTGKSETRALEVGRMAWACKALAKELALPVGLVSQLNRSSEKEGREPQLHDLRDSGEIEQHADVVIFPHREGQTLEEDGPAQLFVRKNRGGRTGSVPCFWRGATMTFHDMAGEGQHGYDRNDRSRYADAE